MEQNKVRTYLLYAIGEILLVVIGILIALQVNNWNQERNIREVSEQAKLNLVEELRKEKSDLETGLELIQRQLDRRFNYINEPQKGLSDSLKIKEMYNLLSYYSDKATLPLLRAELSQGKKIIQWPELTVKMRNLITSVDFFNNQLILIEEYWNQNIGPFLLKSGIVTQFMAIDGYIDRDSYSNADLYYDPEFQNVLANSTLMLNSAKEILQRINKRIDSVIQELEENQSN